MALSAQGLAIAALIAVGARCLRSAAEGRPVRQFLLRRGSGSFLPSAGVGQERRQLGQGLGNEGLHGYSAVVLGPNETTRSTYNAKLYLTQTVTGAHVVNQGPPCYQLRLFAGVAIMARRACT